MKLLRTMEMPVGSNCRVGDVIDFNLENGEHAQAMAMKQEQDGMICLFMNWLSQEYSMNAENSNRGGYDASDLKESIDGKILDLFPAELRERMVPFTNGALLRLPTEKELFGKNEWGTKEPESIEQWEPMKSRRNRIALLGSDGKLKWYWLANTVKSNKAKFFNALFAAVSGDGYAQCDIASAVLGVRLVFKISNQYPTEI